MKVKVTKTMVKELNKTAKAIGVLYSFHYEEISPESYRWNIDYNYFDAADYGDIDKVIDSINAVIGKYPGEWTMDDIYEEAFNGFDCEVTPIPWSDDDTYRELYI